MRLATHAGRVLRSFFITLFITQCAWAIEEEPRNFRGIRSMGMGGALITTGNYSEALFGNPARLAEVDTWKFTMLETTAEINSNIMSDNSELTALRSASGQGTISSASKIIGHNEHLRLQIMTAYYTPNFIDDLAFGIALLTSAQANLTVNYTTDLDNQIIFDVGPTMGFAYPFLDHALTVGMNLRLLYRAASEGTINSLNFLTGSKLSLQNFGRQGFGIDGDLGGYYHIPWELPFMRLSAALTLKNLTKSHYAELSTALMPNVPIGPVNNSRLFDVGFRFDFPDWWWFSAPLLAVEFQDNGDANKRISFAKKTHIGTEARLSRVFSLRLGFNQGYIAAGLGVDLPVVKLDFATYGEELTGNAGLLEDRRFMFRMAFEL